MPFRNRAMTVGAIGAVLAGAVLANGRLAHPQPPKPLSSPAEISDGISVYFSPEGGCEQAVVEQINSARQTVDFQAYSFTSSEIAKALVAAKARGIQLRIILDKNATEERGYSSNFLVDHGLTVLIDGEHATAHNKVVVIDHAIVITGSFNFTKQAEHFNAENLLVIRDHKSLAQAYEHNFEGHLQHSRRYTSKAR